MYRKFIVTIGTIACLASTALVVEPAFARSIGHGGFHAAKSFGGGKGIRHGGGNFKASKMSKAHKPGKIGNARTHKPGKLGNALAHKSGKIGNAPAHKPANGGLGKMANASAKTGNGLGKLNNGTGKLASNNTGKLNNGPGKMNSGQHTNGRIYANKMGPTSNTTPTQNPQTAKDPATVDNYKWIKAEIRKDKLNWTDLQLNTATIKVINEIKRLDRAEWKKRDNEDTNRRRAEQEARENYNPNAEVYRPSGMTEEEHNATNQRSLPGKPNGTE